MFDLNLGTTTNDTIQTDLVENLFPTTTSEKRLAIIGEYPGQIEVEYKLPIAGPTGSFLTGVLTAVGVRASSCYVGNVCQRKPGNNNIASFKWHGPEIQEGINNLRRDLLEFKPNLCLLLGNLPMTATGLGTFGSNKDHEKLGEWRGTLFKSIDGASPFFGFKCLGTYHPSYILSFGYTFKPLFFSDLRRASEESEFAELKLPHRVFNIRPTPQFIQEQCRELQLKKQLISIDIEGVYPNLTCISICDTPYTGFIVPFNEFTPQERVANLRALNALLTDAEVPKVLQHGLFDVYNLARTFNILVQGIVADTEMSAWELNPEIPKDLGTLASIYTKEPKYKSDRKVPDRDVHFLYCCKDSAVTYEIHNIHQQLLHGPPKSHYDFNIALMAPTNYIQLRGIKYDTVKRDEALKNIDHFMSVYQTRLDARAKPYLGETAKVNVNSPKQLKALLYDHIGLPIQYAKVGNTYDKTKPTTDVDACLELFTKFNDPIVTDILSWRSFEKQRQYCNLLFDNDGRIRSSYNIIGTVTGRFSSSKTLSGTGYNLTTIPKKLRNQYVADNGHWFFQCDLEGADGWTIAAWCKALGDPTMWDDYHYGLKPAKIIALLHTIGASANNWSRDKLREEVASIDQAGGLYFTCKRAQHSTTYGSGAQKMAGQILKDMYKYEGKLLHVPKTLCADLQRLYANVRYPGVLSYQNRIKNIITSSRGTPEIACASGHVRKFHGRPNDHKTYTDALAHEPQANTTYSTNLALLNLWNDPENRRPNGSLIIEPLHQVHDALCGQFPKELTEWACKKIQSYFSNTLTIAGLEVKIPFDGEYGPSWGEQGAKYGGGRISSF